MIRIYAQVALASDRKMWTAQGPLRSNINLKLLVKLTRRAGNENPPGDAPLAVFHPLHDARGFDALGTVRALGGVHDFLAIR